MALDEGYGVGMIDDLSDNHLALFRRDDDWSIFETAEEAARYLPVAKLINRNAIIRRVRRISSAALVRPLFEILLTKEPPAHACELPEPVRPEVHETGYTTHTCALCFTVWVLVQAGPKTEDNPHGETWRKQIDVDAFHASHHRRTTLVGPDGMYWKGALGVYNQVQPGTVEIDKAPLSAEGLAALQESWKSRPR